VGFLFEGFVLVEPLFRVLVESLKICDVWRVGKEVREILIKLLNKHSELGSPVTDVVDSLDIVVQELKNPTNRIALNSRPQMAHMHIFGDVRG